jgi:hypothetical protein
MTKLLFMISQNGLVDEGCAIPCAAMQARYSQIHRMLWCTGVIPIEAARMKRQKDTDNFRLVSMKRQERRRWPLCVYSRCAVSTEFLNWAMVQIWVLPFRFTTQSRGKNIWYEERLSLDTLL